MQEWEYIPDDNTFERRRGTGPAQPPELITSWLFGLWGTLEAPIRPIDLLLELCKDCVEDFRQKDKDTEANALSRLITDDGNPIGADASAFLTPLIITEPSAQTLTGAMGSLTSGWALEHSANFLNLTP